MKKPPPRKLHRGHFAFMRALAQGVDERASWERYLRLEGEHVDLRTVRRTIAWIRDAFAAAARREHKPGTARLILLDPERFSAAPALPSLAEFAAARGLEDFSEAEQVEAYQAAYPQARAGQGGASAQPSRRARVIARQLEALRWLENLVAQNPRPGDSVAAWLHPALAERLERAGIATLEALVERINARGARWWVQVPGVGERKAARILDWLHANEQVLGLRVGPHAVQPRAQASAEVLAAVVPAATALVPYEKFVLPAGLDGRAGCFRAPTAACRLRAANDHEAIGAWLAAKGKGAGTAVLSATQRSYRREAERLLLWAVLERGKALSSLTPEDAFAYRAFLANPPPAWCGPRHHQRWSSGWRPLEGALTPVALRQSLVILRSLFEFLVSHGYALANPFAQVALPAQRPVPLGARRMLSIAQWDRVDDMLSRHADTQPGRRLRRAMRWLYATGLRLAEVTALRCGDLARVDAAGHGAEAGSRWQLAVAGKGARRRQVPVPAELVEELGAELARHGLDREVDAASNREIPVLARFDAELRPLSWSASGLYQAIKAFLARAAEGLEESEAQQLRKASTHWLRHSCGAHALQGRDGQPALPLKVVQAQLGHAFAGTTSMYLRAGAGPAEQPPGQGASSGERGEHVRG
ncbi:integrase [Variovorax sp. TBS-050B]|uniref:phage integrase family protein n=1 Tax=Variovorax sp. TBS-050B TaxID=2940551 RepID=UPI002472EE52|nr:phage integrase family protein [Variovorax sp. TBS-050B]MDH6590670.1 integrase [Variovorax sp. TBS-050B]